MFKIGEIKEICQTLGIKPLKNKGQNFLVNPRVLKMIISAAELKKDDFVLEIGAGFGILTKELAQKVKKVIAIEIDKKLVEFLKEKFKNDKNIEIILGDILKTDLKVKIKDLSYKVVANLPYNITGAVLRKFLSEAPKPKLMVLMVQKEVAERILAKNNKNTIISLMVAFYGQPEIIGFVSKNSFWPKPKVDSAILRIVPINQFAQTDTDKKHRLTQIIDEDKFFQLVRQGFFSPRKQLVNNLKKIIEKEKLEKILKKLKINPKIRPEDLNLKNWLDIYKLLQIKNTKH